MSDIIKPMIRLKPNQCPKCLGYLDLIEEETYVAPLDGNAISQTGQSFVDLYLKCRDCQTMYPAIKKGIRYFIAPISAPTVVMKEYNPFYIH